ncbi:glycosyltransferase family 2 protein [Planktosalinus lacus]|uniref:Glycosyl transferase n=1 Tax=Planktosalinus lacus TaxID=1526573 RepID=A0A8J2Y939_9FLAO|nr:glycosyltransferase family 2 protein [Planktosalinus lacus]GGD84920.1 glycosyl transferase [Planktosalinus lacus]
MSNITKKIFIVTVTYNAMPWIDRCLQSAGNHPVIVVDNASTDKTVAHIQSNYPKVTLLPQDKNIGFGQGNNVGISYALKHGAESIFLLNQDAYLVDDCLEVLVKKQQVNPQFGILSPIHLNGKGNVLDRNFGNYISFQKAPKLMSDLLIDKSGELYEVPFVNAAGWLLSRECIETVGGFDPIFFHYGEDDNYCQRVLYHGLKIGIVLDTFLRHDREDRVIKPIMKYSNAYYKQLERRYKLIYGDVNKKEFTIQKEINQLKKKLLRHYLKLQFSNASKTKTQLTLLKSLIEPIAVSRKKNIEPGEHYL